MDFRDFLAVCVMALLIMVPLALFGLLGLAVWTLSLPEWVRLVLEVVVAFVAGVTISCLLLVAREVWI